MNGLQGFYESPELVGEKAHRYMGIFHQILIQSISKKKKRIRHILSKE